MRKYLLLSILTSMFISIAASAAEPEMTIGYCSGLLPSKGTVSFPGSDTWVSGAIFIPSETLSPLAGNRIEGINAGMATRLNVDSLTVWIRTDLNGPALAEQLLPEGESIAKGWNTIFFDSPWEIPSDNNGIYIGYSFFQKKSAYGLAVLDEPTENALFTQAGSSPWNDRSDRGTLCVEGIVRGDNLPKYNLALTSLTTNPVHILADGPMKLTGTVRNIACCDISAFDILPKINGRECAPVTVGCPVEAGKSSPFTAYVDVEALPGENLANMEFTIVNIAEGNDEDMSDNSLMLTIELAREAYERHVLSEEFTTEQCPNCPRVAEYIHSALAKQEFKEKVHMVCHHAGYYTDWLTTSFDADYTWLFNDHGRTYAPAVATDRKARGAQSALDCPAAQSALENSWRDALADYAFVRLDISAEFNTDEPSILKVHVDGEKSIPMLCDYPHLTIWIVEDGIEAKRQAGATGTYIHNHVNRAVNETWGAPISFSGDLLEYECEFSLDNSWNRDNMLIVAALANYNPDDATDCEVQNCASLNFADISGITCDATAIEADFDSLPEEIFTLTGTRVAADALAPGIYVARKGNKSRKIMVR